MRIKKLVFLGYCPSCGRDVVTDFCDHCGAYTQEPPEEEKCRSTRTSAKRDTPGMKYGAIKGRKRRKEDVRSARELKDAIDRMGPRFRPK